jgi:two-component system CheB/CheR fusion protein
MARPGLLFELQSAVDEVKKTGIEAERHNVNVDTNGGSRPATVRVIPFQPPVQDQRNYIIVFEPPPNSGGASAQNETEPLTETERGEKDKQIAHLRQELAATKEYLQSIIETHESTNEELQSANEEIQSGNEELQSTNEELQTSKEELESANEELHTVNEEMQHRNELLTQANNDLTNLLNSINLAMIMVSSDLSVRRFTPQATAILGLMPSDVGRPIPRLKLKVDVRALEQMMLDVIQQVQPRHEQVQDEDGRWFNLRITPYRTLDNRIDGVVVTAMDRAAIDGFEGNSTDGRTMTKKKSAAKGKR